MKVPKPPKITINGEEVPHSAALWLCYVAAKSHNSLYKGKVAELLQPTIDALIDGGENIGHFRNAEPHGLSVDWFPRLRKAARPLDFSIGETAHESIINEANKRARRNSGGTTEGTIKPKDKEGWWRP